MRSRTLMAAVMLAALNASIGEEQEINYQRPWPVPKKPQTKNQAKSQRRKGKKGRK